MAAMAIAAVFVEPGRIVLGRHLVEDGQGGAADMAPSSRCKEMVQ